MADAEYLRRQIDHYFPPWPWALDFCRAMSERPLWAKLLFRLALGKYAYREFIGLQNAFLGTGDNPFWEGVGHGCDYFKDSVPFLWWKERSYQTKEPAVRL
jgi:hypothetical protein